MGFVTSVELHRPNPLRSELRLKYVAIYSSNKSSEILLCLPLYDHT